MTLEEMDRETSGDLTEAIQMLAADNAQLCERIIRAERVVERLRDYLDARRGPYHWSPSDPRSKLQALIDEYDAGKPS